MGEHPLNKQLLLRVSEADLEYLEDTTSRMPGLKKSAVARAALRLGLDELRQNPAAFMDAGPRETDSAD